jgi:enediyne biosynthesis protein E4
MKTLTTLRAISVVRSGLCICTTFVSGLVTAKVVASITIGSVLISVSCSDSGQSDEAEAIAPKSKSWPSTEVAENIDAAGIVGYPLREKSGSGGPQMFTEMPVESSGVDLINSVEADHPMGFLYHSGFACGGVAVGDVDGDGWPDLYFTGGAGPNKLYCQVPGPGGEIHFEDITTKAGNLDGGENWAGSASMADIDGDGDLDIYVVNYDAPNELFVNRGVAKDGIVRFEERAKEFGLDLVDACHTPAFCDYDNDGDLDLYVLTNRYEDTRGYRGNDAHQRVNGRRVIKPDYEKYYVVWEDGQDWGVRAYGREDYLLRNEGGKFRDVTKEAGISGRGDGLSATWWDANDDGLMDLHVGNDMIAQDKLYMNQGDGTFKDEINDRMPHTS